MKLYSSIGPSPRIARICAAEKRVALEVVHIDIVADDPRLTDYRQVNPFGSTPALVLDDGRVITESLTIGEYLDEIGEGPSLVGRTAEERASARMWSRRVDFGFVMPIILGFRATAGRAMFAPRLRVAPESAGDELTAMGFDFLDQIETECAAADYLAGERFTLGGHHPALLRRLLRGDRPQAARWPFLADRVARPRIRAAQHHRLTAQRSSGDRGRIRPGRRPDAMR